ncbi:MAG: NADH-quinone oxidoreductase subunit C [Alphaproteobacteria bacterium]|jgi:NADH-quinone oxidoreductase subunit C|nr:NADH-quinone oxidoreductase subunit C [Alphaproteobacteria bacterium]
MNARNSISAKPLEALAATIEDQLGPDLIQKNHAHGELTLTVYAGSILRVLTILRDNSKCHFKQLIDICSVDYPDRPQRFDVVYHLLSVTNNHRVRIKIATDGVTPISSVTGIYPCANWYEREVWDMMGIPFSDHPDLRRLLTDYNFEGHPLRKDFPLTGFYEVRYDDEVKRVVYEPVSLPQDYRTFDFLSPWEGIMEEKSKPSESPTPSSSQLLEQGESK